MPKQVQGSGEGVGIDSGGRFGFLDLLGLPAEPCRPCLIGRTVLSSLWMVLAAALHRLWS